MPDTNGETQLKKVDTSTIQEAQEIDMMIRQKLEELRVQERSEFLQFRKTWSRNLLYLVIFIVGFNALFLIAVGLRWLTFMDEWLVRIIITGSFVEVLGLAKIIVDFLFKEPPKDN